MVGHLTTYLDRWRREDDARHGLPEKSTKDENLILRSPAGCPNVDREGDSEKYHITKGVSTAYLHVQYNTSCPKAIVIVMYAVSAELFMRL